MKAAEHRFPAAGRALSRSPTPERPANGHSPTWMTTGVVWPAWVQRYGTNSSCNCYPDPKGDILEQEADRTAERIVSQPEQQDRSAHFGQLPASPTARHRSNPKSSAALVGYLGAGRPLRERDRALFEARLGADLGDVQLHTGDASHRAADSLHAHAFTIGSHVGFAAGRFAPDTVDGKKLLAHEITHVLQQRRGGAGAAANAPVQCQSVPGDLSGGVSTHAPPPTTGEAGYRSGSADDVEKKFFLLADMSPYHPFPNFSSPRDLDDYIVTHPDDELLDANDAHDFNRWVMHNLAAMHPVTLSKKLNLILTAKRYTAYTNQQLDLHLVFTYPNRSYKLWAGPLSREHLSYEWKGKSSARTQPSILPDMSSDYIAYILLGDEGEYNAWCKITLGGGSRVEDSMTVTLDRPIIVVGTPEEFASESSEKAATQEDVEGNDPLFEKGGGGVYRKPGATPLTLEQMITVNSIKMGALKELRQRGKISEKDYNDARAYFEKRNKGLREARLPSSGVYLLSGAFVSDEHPDTVPIRAVMANYFPSTQFRVVLQDVTLDPEKPTKHEGAADQPKTVDKAAWVETELKAILAMADDWKANNDYPHGLVTLYIGSAVDETVTFTIAISQQNWKKTLRSILAPVAMVAAVGAMLVGQAEIAVPLMYVGMGAGLANIALGIKDRIDKGKFGFDAALLMDALQVVTMFMGVGAMSQAFRTFSPAGKVFYLVGMGAADLTQGILLGAEAKKQIDDAREKYQAKLKLAKTDDDRRAAQQEYETTVADSIGAAVVAGSFLVASTVAGVRGIKKLPKPGGSPIEGLPVRPPGQHEPPVKATDQPSKPTAEPEPRQVEAEPSARPVASGPEAEPPRTVANRLGIDLNRLERLSSPNGRCFKPQGGQNPKPAEVKLGDQVAATRGEDLIFPKKNNQDGIDGFFRPSDQPVQLKTLEGAAKGQTTKMVSRANDAFDAASRNGWTGVDVHIEAPLITKADALSRWSVSNRVPKLRDMGSGAVEKITVHCSDGAVELPIPGRDMPVPPSGGAGGAAGFGNQERS